MTIQNRENKFISCAGGLLFAWLAAAGGFASLCAQTPLEQTSEQRLSLLGQAAVRRLIFEKGFAEHPFAFRPLAQPLTITPDNWLRGNGNWNAGALLVDWRDAEFQQ